MFMQHGSSVTLVFLYEGAAQHGCGASSARDPRLQQLELAVIAQVVARRQAWQALAKKPRN